MEIKQPLAATQAFSYLSAKPTLSRARQIAKHALTLLGIFSLVGFAIWVQFPKDWLSLHLTESPSVLYPLLGLFLLAKAYVAVEAGGYFVHRYLEHVGFMTRLSSFIREGQKFHWSHHMIIYPLNKQYIKGNKYIDSQNYGIAWQWIVPLLVLISISFYSMGWKPETLVFVCLTMGYAKINEHVHARFHFFGHSFENSRYFQWISDVHILHHFDQEVNFGMTSPLMDVLFGTYMAPKGDFLAIKAFMKSNDLNSADFINWHYLLTEATKEEYAQSIVDVQKYPGMLKKAGNMVDMLSQFSPADFYYEEAFRLKEGLNAFLHHAKTHAATHSSHPIPVQDLV